MKRLLGVGIALCACSAQDDGVLAIAFQLGPPPATEARVLPPEAQTGVAPFAFSQAHGRCDADVAARTLRCTFEGLPPAASGQPLAYELQLLLWYGPLPAGFDARTLDRDPGGHDPDAPPPVRPPALPRAMAGAVNPDPLGSTERRLAKTDIPLDRIAGGELFLVVTADGAVSRHLVIDGRVGNLDEGAPSGDRPPTAVTPHHH